MATSQMSEFLQHLCTEVLLQQEADRTDGQLLERFLSRHDESALAAIVLRHAPMVWGVCRRILGNDHDAEDAFQATFLVLVRKAAAIARPELLANWLYGAASQTAAKARATAARRRAREKQVAEMPEPAAATRDHLDELRALLDQELSRLPEKYRLPIVLCDLEERTRQEAARKLGWPEGTVAGRLARAREMLARRLARRGVVLSGGSVAALAQEASAGVPAAVVSSTLTATSRLAAGPVAGGAITVEVLELTEGVLKTMWLRKLKQVAAVLLAMVVLMAGLTTAGLLSLARPAQGTPAPIEKKGDGKGLAALQGTWRISKLDIEHGEIREQFEKLGKVVVQGDKVALLLDLSALAGEKKVITWAEFTIVKIDPSKSPSSIDLRLDKAIEIAGAKPKTGGSQPGIYSLKGDTLKLFFGEEARPRAFPKEAKQGLITLRRVAEPKGKDARPKGERGGKD